ncbi:hypothetical protein [Bacillus sp. EB01]|uniref:hypothetical protein n=1 Tax=Bacillus sp. EB01 TaxID=1347086 RepID=UPI0005C77341|nr:hypothetical protein [Bacillus sp. EB01]
MKKIILILFFMYILVGIFGCQQNNEKKISNTERITFSGEAEYWKATIVNEILQGSDGLDFTLSIEYKGDLEDLKDVRQISYNYKYGTEEIKRSENTPEGLPTNKAIVYVDNERNYTTSIDKQTVVPFKIEWNDKIEEFELKFSK